MNVTASVRAYTEATAHDPDSYLSPAVFREVICGAHTYDSLPADLARNVTPARAHATTLLLARTKEVLR